jgi:uncharacterized membrane protein (DUF485 family)
MSTSSSHSWNQLSPDPFTVLRARQRQAVTLLGTIFFGWFGLFLTLAAAAPAVMQTRWGPVSLGWVYALTLIPLAVLVALAYARFANRVLDPLRTQIRSGAVVR